MATVATNQNPFPIYYTPDVHGFYMKQKNEFHFNQKSDNEFLMFLLDTAVRVISIVQHLAPVIEAVSDASGDEVEDMSPGTPNSVSANTMDVDSGETRSPQPHVPPLSAELEQINQEITNAQISAKPPNQQIRQTSSYSSQQVPMSQPRAPQPQAQLLPPDTMEDVPVMQNVNQPPPPPVLPVAPAPVVPSYTPDPEPVNTPAVQLPTSAQVSESLPTNLQTAAQPIAEAPHHEPDSEPVKTELPVPEIIEIKEEVAESAMPASSSSSNLLSPDTLQQLMSSIGGNEENVGLQNFVTTATPSNLPPSFLDRSATNPLSMLGSLNSGTGGGGDGAGPSGLNMTIPNISESMMKNINDAGLNVSSIKGQANPMDPWQRRGSGRHTLQNVESMREEYYAILHGFSQTKNVQSTCKQLGVCRSMFYQKKSIVELLVAAPELFAALRNQALREHTRIKTFSLQCKAALTSPGLRDRVVALRNQGVLLPFSLNASTF